MSKKNRVSKYLAISCAVIFILLSFVYYGIRVYSDARSEAYEELKDFSEQINVITQVQMEGALSSISGMSTGFTGFDDIHSEQAQALLGRLIHNTNFTRMCVTDLQGVGIFDDGSVVDLSDRAYFQNAINGDRGFSDLHISKYSDDYCFSVYAPIYDKNGSIKGMLHGTYELPDLKKVIHIQRYGGGNTYFFDKDGRYVISADEDEAIEMGDDIMEHLTQIGTVDKFTIDELCEQMKAQKSGFFTYRIGKDRYVVYYQPSNIKDWYSISMIPNSVIVDITRKSAEYSAMLLFCCIIAFLVIVINYIVDERRRKKEELHKLEEKQSRITEQYANEIKNSYDAILEFDYGNNQVYTYTFTGEGIERQLADYKDLNAMLDRLSQGIICNAEIGNIKDFFSIERLDKAFLAGKNELNVDVQRRETDGTYRWYTLFMRKAHWSIDGDKIAMFYAKNIDELYQEQRKNYQITIDALHMANEASQAKSDFLSRMSHDIRTPMNAIMGMTVIAQDNLEDVQKVSDCIKKIDESSQYLLSLVNDVLDMSRIESGKVEILEEETSYQEFFHRIQLLIEPMAEKKSITFIDKTAQTEGLCLYTDKLHLQQVFMNLLSNAIKYTPSGGTVQLLAEKLDEGDTNIFMRFIIRDDGIGIKEDQLEKIFRPFERAENREQNGTGLGLTIAHDLVKLMHGVITVKSEIGKGSDFIIDIPFRKAVPAPEKETKEESVSAAEKKKSASQSYDFTGKRALVVEDNITNMEIAKVFLEKVHFELDLAEDGESALQKYLASEENYYDVIITDIRMPGMDGRELTAQIRKADRNDAGTVPIIAMSAEAFSEEIQLSQSVGMNDYITKPIKPSTLYKTLHKYIS